MRTTTRQLNALRVLKAYGHGGAFQAQLARQGISASLLAKLGSLGLAESMMTVLGQRAWFITELGRKEEVETEPADPLVLSEYDQKRFWRFVEKGTGCWLWTGSLAGHGYGAFSTWLRGTKRTQRAHRLSYRMLKGPIPDDLVVMHSCDTPACVNPDHLSLGTLSENILDSVRKGRARQSRKTHCPQGHPYSGDNLVVSKDGRRRKCKICRAASAREYQRRKARLGGQ